MYSSPTTPKPPTPWAHRELASCLHMLIFPHLLCHPATNTNLTLPNTNSIYLSKYFLLDMFYLMRRATLERKNILEVNFMNQTEPQIFVGYFINRTKMWNSQCTFLELKKLWCKSNYLLEYQNHVSFKTTMPNSSQFVRQGWNSVYNETTYDLPDPLEAIIYMDFPSPNTSVNTHLCKYTFCHAYWINVQDGLTLRKIHLLWKRFRKHH